MTHDYLSQHSVASKLKANREFKEIVGLMSSMHQVDYEEGLTGGASTQRISSRDEQDDGASVLKKRGRPFGAKNKIKKPKSLPTDGSETAQSFPTKSDERD